MNDGTFSQTFRNGGYMGTFLKVLLIILIIVIVLLVILFFIGRKMQKKQDAQQAQIEANKQTVSMLIIDKKKMKLMDSGLPQSVLAQTPKMMRRSKLPIVKAKIGPPIMSLVCDAKIFEDVPVKKEVKAVISGIYITEVKGLRKPITDADTGKKKPRTRRRCGYRGSP